MNWASSVEVVLNRDPHKSQVTLNGVPVPNVVSVDVSADAESMPVATIRMIGMGVRVDTDASVLTVVKPFTGSEQSFAIQPIAETGEDQ